MGRPVIDGLIAQFPASVEEIRARPHSAGQLNPVKHVEMLVDVVFVRVRRHDSPSTEKSHTHDGYRRSPKKRAVADLRFDGHALLRRLFTPLANIPYNRRYQVRYSFFDAVETDAIDGLIVQPQQNKGVAVDGSGDSG